MDRVTRRWRSDRKACRAVQRVVEANLTLADGGGCHLKFRGYRHVETVLRQCSQNIDVVEHVQQRVVLPERRHGRAAGS